MREYTHGGLGAHRQRVSTTFLTQGKTRQFFLCSILMGFEPRVIEPMSLDALAMEPPRHNSDVGSSTHPPWPSLRAASSLSSSDNSGRTSLLPSPCFSKPSANPSSSSSSSDLMAAVGSRKYVFIYLLEAYSPVNCTGSPQGFSQV